MPCRRAHGAEVLEFDDRSEVALHQGPAISRVLHQEHNTVLPHSAFRGQTPDEMYGTGDAVPADLTAGAAAARRVRIEANRSAACERCPSVDAAA